MSNEGIPGPYTDRISVVSSVGYPASASVSVVSSSLSAVWLVQKKSMGQYPVVRSTCLVTGHVRGFLAFFVLIRKNLASLYMLPP